MKISRYVPTSVDENGFGKDFQNETTEFNSLEELLNIPWVKEFSESFSDSDYTFHRFSVISSPSKKESRPTLLAEYNGLKGSTFLVVGFFENDSLEMVKLFPEH